MLKKFWTDEQGATAIEYGLILGGMSIVICAAVAVVGEAIRIALFEKVAAAIAG